MSNRAAIVVTTIFEPTFLRGYLDDLRANGREQTTTLFVIPDRKTPASVSEAAGEARRQGFDVRCPGLDEQQRFLSALDLPEDFIPWNTDNRRNVGFLMALESGCELLISIDDDNYCLAEGDFVGAHAQVGRPARLLVGADCALVEANANHSRFFNACDLLALDGPTRVFPRGFPYFARHAGEQAPLTGTEGVGLDATVAINVGLWLVDPDVDAVTRLAVAPRSEAFRGRSVILGRDVWSPLNTQNTALTRDAAAAYYYVRMGHPLDGIKIDRYGDILSGYFVQRCAKHLGQGVRLGTPIAAHRRTPHDLFKDLREELGGMVLIEELLPWLVEEPLDGTSYLESYRSLAERLAAAAGRFKGPLWDAGGREFLTNTAARMKTWSTVVERFGSTGRT